MKVWNLRMGKKQQQNSVLVQELRKKKTNKRNKQNNTKNKNQNTIKNVPYFKPPSLSIPPCPAAVCSSVLLILCSVGQH